MRVLTYTGAPRPEWREAPELRIEGRLEAIVRPIAATTCDLDRAILAGRTPLPPPFALGHECVAEVMEIGDGVRAVLPGMQVVVPWHISCGACGRCRRGLTASCEAVTPRAMYGTPIGGDWGGLFSDRVRVPFADAMLVPLPAGVAPAQVASASDNLTDAWMAASRMLARHPGADVLVAGGNGSIGLYAVQAALAEGAASVTYVDKAPERLELAASLGARPLARGAELGEFLVVVDASGHPGELARALRAVAPGGSCHSVGIYFLDAPLPLLDMYAKDVTFTTGRPSVGPHIARVLELVAAGRLRPERIGAAAPWDDAPDVLAARPLKPILVRPPLTEESRLA
jgi:alcohol dehydrogenase